MTYQKVIEGFSRMKEITSLLIELDFENENNFEKLNVLQKEQEVLRNTLTPWIEDHHEHQLKDILQECIVLEKNLQSKILKYRGLAEEQISKMQNGTRTKNVYSGSFFQAEGYFFDSRN